MSSSEADYVDLSSIGNLFHWSEVTTENAQNIPLPFQSYLIVGGNRGFARKKIAGIWTQLYWPRVTPLSSNTPTLYASTIHWYISHYNYMCDACGVHSSKTQSHLAYVPGPCVQQSSVSHGSKCLLSLYLMCLLAANLSCHSTSTRLFMYFCLPFTQFIFSPPTSAVIFIDAEQWKGPQAKNNSMSRIKCLAWLPFLTVSLQRNIPLSPWLPRRLYIQ